MRRVKGIITIFIYISLLMFGYSTNLSYAEKTATMGGWEPGGPYDRHYDNRKRESFKGEVLKIYEVVPMEKMSPGVAILIKRRSDSKIITSHVCPTWYLKPDTIGIKAGDRIKIMGAWTKINNKDVFIASKIKKGDYFVLKIRFTSNGKPFWALPSE